jgi:alanine--tRNA ligase
LQKKGLNEIRKSFRDFYVSKGHYAAKSASLVPQNDKSLLIINSGMAPLKRYFAGLDTPPAKRMTTCQKCIRTGDIENVGITSRHGTFFEMLGNFSFGDYFKEQSLTWGWEFITKVLELPTDKIWATVYEDDTEAEKIWEKLGMPAERIVRLGKEDNFWEIGLGPCGPCSEIYFDRGEEYGCDREDCKPGCDCDRYVEFWNHVFTQFSKEEDGSYSNLEHPNIDTGMGLERIACIMQGVTSIFDIDTIQYILQGVLERSGIKYEEAGTEKTDISVRIITDHLRSMVFMIADGIIPSNEGRGYVLRRIIRRAARHGNLIGINGRFLSDMADRVIAVSGEAYPELVEKQQFIKKIIAVEEEKFASTIQQGIDIIQGYVDEMKQQGKTVLDGEKMFKLYDTYGFPPELTEEILLENDFTADKDGFKANMEKQKEQARAGRKSEYEEGWKEAVTAVDVPETKFVGYHTLTSDSKVLAILKSGAMADFAEQGETVRIYLDQTPFYAEGGGQIYDTGVIEADGFKASVKSVSKQNGAFCHEVEILDGKLSVGDSVSCFVDRVRRNMVARNHTATHLLHKALRMVVGEHIQQAGSFVNENSLRFDFTHFEGLTKEQLKEVEAIVNEEINRFEDVETLETDIETAKSKGAMALFGEKYGDTVRMVSCGNFSVELCGGTHVHNTGEIGCFKLLSESGVASGVRRIEAVSACAVYDIANKQAEVIEDCSAELKCNKDQLKNKIVSLSEELKNLRHELAEFKKAQLGNAATSLLAEAKDVNGIKVITKKFDSMDAGELRTLADDIKKESNNVAMIFAAVDGEKAALLVSLSDDLVEAGFHAGKIVKEVAVACGGGGGGKANMAQAGAKDISKLDEAFVLAENLFK